MPDISYRVLFHQIDGSTPEEFWFNNADEAWEMFRSFAKPDSREDYKSIEIFEVNFAAQSEHKLATMRFCA